MHPRTILLPLLLAATALADARPSRAVVHETRTRAIELLHEAIAPRLVALERAPTYRGTITSGGERVEVVAALLDLQPTYRALVLVAPDASRAAIVWAYTTGTGALLRASLGPLAPREDERGGYCGECTLPLDGGAITASLGFDRERPIVLDLRPDAALAARERRALIAASLFEPESALSATTDRDGSLVVRARLTDASPGPGPDAQHPTCSLLHDVHAAVEIASPERPSALSIADLAVDASTRRCCTPPYRGCCSPPRHDCVDAPADL